MKELPIEMRNEIVAMGKEGHSVTEIHEATNVSKGTIQKYLRKAGVLSSDPRERGGRISNSILIPTVENGYNDHGSVNDETEILPVMLADQTIKIAGTETLTVYRAETTKDFVTVESENLIGQIKINDIPKIILELKGVYQMVAQLKSNRWGVM